jgi:hypothetical protein
MATIKDDFGGAPKPTKEEQKAALELIANKLKTVKGKLVFRKVCVNNPVVQECEEIAEKAGVRFDLGYQKTNTESLTYWPKSPHENGWYDPDADYDDGFWWPEARQGWMSSTDECNSYE